MRRFFFFNIQNVVISTEGSSVGAAVAAFPSWQELFDKKTIKKGILKKELLNLEEIFF